MLENKFVVNTHTHTRYFPISSAQNALPLLLQFLVLLNSQVICVLLRGAFLDAPAVSSAILRRGGVSSTVCLRVCLGVSPPHCPLLESGRPTREGRRGERKRRPAVQSPSPRAARRPRSPLGGARGERSGAQASAKCAASPGGARARRGGRTSPGALATKRLGTPGRPCGGVLPKILLPARQGRWGPTSPSPPGA